MKRSRECRVGIGEGEGGLGGSSSVRVGVCLSSADNAGSFLSDLFLIFATATRGSARVGQTLALLKALHLTTLINLLLPHF